MQEMIPITLFIGIAYAIHALADARARGCLVAPHVPEEVIRALADLEEARRRMRDLTFGAAAALPQRWLAAQAQANWWPTRLPAVAA